MNKESEEIEKLQEKLGKSHSEYLHLHKTINVLIAAGFVSEEKVEEAKAITRNL